MAELSMLGIDAPTGDPTGTAVFRARDQVKGLVKFFTGGDDLHPASVGANKGHGGACRKNHLVVLHGGAFRVA